MDGKKMEVAGSAGAAPFVGHAEAVAGVARLATLVTMIAQAILNGHKPSIVFDEYLAANPGSDKYEIAGAFADAFPDVDSVCHQVIWNFRCPGMTDEKLDLILIDLLQKAKYSLKIADR